MKALSLLLVLLFAFSSLSLAERGGSRSTHQPRHKPKIKSTMEQIFGPFLASTTKSEKRGKTEYLQRDSEALVENLPVVTEKTPMMGDELAPTLNQVKLGSVNEQSEAVPEAVDTFALAQTQSKQIQMSSTAFNGFEYAKGYPKNINVLSFNIISSFPLVSVLLDFQVTQPIDSLMHHAVINLIKTSSHRTFSDHGSVDSNLQNSAAPYVPNGYFSTSTYHLVYARYLEDLRQYRGNLTANLSLVDEDGVEQLAIYSEFKL